MSNNEHNQAVLGAFLDKIEVIDDHTQAPIQLAALVEFAQGHLPMSGIIKGAVRQSLNKIYLNEGDRRLHLSEVSVGGEIVVRSEDDILSAIEKYNNSIIHKSNIITKITFQDGRKIDVV